MSDDFITVKNGRGCAFGQRLEREIDELKDEGKELRKEMLGELDRYRKETLEELDKFRKSVDRVNWSLVMVAIFLATTSLGLLLSELVSP